MSNLRKYLSCEQDEALDPFSVDDINWISKDVLGLKNGFDQHQLKVIQDLSTLDVEACPGSGKTTVLVAKLALIARYWVPRTKGLCVLSMTNAARIEIQERLGATVEGQLLLKPPHFIGTIHSFAGKFLAKQWLNMKGMWVQSIDDDFCRAQRRKVLQKQKYLPLTDDLVQRQYKKHLDKFTAEKLKFEKKGVKTKKYEEEELWLYKYDESSKEERRLRVPIHDWKIINSSFEIRNFGKEVEVCEENKILLTECVKEVAQNGSFCFSDIFVFADSLIHDDPSVVRNIRNRFPLLFIDEAQDTSKSQAEFLHSLFMDGELCVVRQRFGDPSQTIYNFEKPMLKDGVDPFPHESIKRLTIPVSHRFDQSIADLAGAFATEPLQFRMKGAREDVTYGRNHCIFLFESTTQKHVIPSYVEYVAKELSSDELLDSVIYVCSHIHKERENASTSDNYARTIKDYYTPYVSDKISKEYSDHNHLITYFRHAYFLSKEDHSFNRAVEKLADGIVRAAFILHDEMPEECEIVNSIYNNIKSKEKKNRAIKSELERFPDLEKDYNKILTFGLLKNNVFDRGWWMTIRPLILNIINKLVSRKEKQEFKHNFLAWVEEDFDSVSSSKEESVSVEETGNVYSHKFINGELPIKNVKIGTIHSVKGQTHTSTLIVESTNRGPILGSLKKYILGADNSKEATSTSKDFLNTLYVGMTRPTHLICLALPKSHMKTSQSKKPIEWDSKDIDVLKSKGWKVFVIKEDGTLIDT